MEKKSTRRNFLKRIFPLSASMVGGLVLANTDNAEGASGERIALLEREVGELKIERLVELYNQYNSDVELFKNSNIHGNREECIYDSGVGEVLTLLEREIERFRENYNMRVSLFGINGVGFGSTKSQTSITYIQERSSHRPTRLAVKF